MSVQYKNVLIIVQSVLLLLAIFYIWQTPEQQPQQQFQQLPAVLAKPIQSESSSPAAPTTVKATPAPTTIPDDIATAKVTVDATTEALPQTTSSQPAEPTQLAEVMKTQQLWSSHIQEGIDVEWSQQYQQELQDFFVTESALKNFKPSDIQCRQSSCRLQLKLPKAENLDQQQLLLATALNPLREQGKIGVYLIGEANGQQLQLVIERPEQEINP